MKRILGIIWMCIILIAMMATLTSCKDAIVSPINVGSGEAAMSSPILGLGEGWQGVMSGIIDVSASYDSLTTTVTATVRNVSSQKLCWGLSEPHLKLGTMTVGELGPEKLGDILPGEEVISSLTVKNDPKYSGYVYDGYVIHMEMYDCSGGAPPPY